MLPLRALRFDDDIVGAEVYVLNEVTGGYEVVDTHDARSIARAQGLHLIACWPEDSEPEFVRLGAPRLIRGDMRGTHSRQVVTMPPTTAACLSVALVGGHDVQHRFGVDEPP
jgi:hypothetical protein